MRVWRCQREQAHAAITAVVLLRRVALALCGLVLLHAPARAAILIHEYALRGSLEDTLGGDSLTALGGQITALGYVFAANEGLAFSSRIFNPSAYSIELSFRLDDTKETTKIVDFHSLAADPGLYLQEGKLAFNPTATGTFSDFTADTDVHVVLTRDGATNLFTAYVNGEQRFSFHDDLFMATPPGFSNKLGIFVDTEFDGSGGTANFLRIYNGPLNASEVSALFAALPPSVVPEPSTFVLLAMGGLTLALKSRRRRRRQLGK
jgi:hypothetical protein